MRPMNEILVDIVNAVSGTVTDPNSRNGLLGDWLSAVETPAITNILTLNGVDQYIECPRLEDVELPGVSIEIEGYFDLTAGGTLWSQNESTFEAFSSFHVNINFGSDTINVVLRGVTTSFSIPAMDRGFGLWALKLSGGNYTFSKDGNQLSSGPFTEGTQTEPTATFKIGARGNGGGASNFMTGETRGHKIWINGDRNTGTLSRAYDVNDGFSVNPLIVESENSEDGTAINITSGDWSTV